MRGTDVRSWKIAVISDRTVNAHLSGDDAAARMLERLVAEGHGLLVLPPAEVTGATARTAILYAVDQLQDYAKNGYVLIDALMAEDDGLVNTAFHAECRLRGLSLPRYGKA